MEDDRHENSGRMFRKTPLEQLRANAPVVSLAMAFFVALATVHVFFVRAAVRETLEQHDTNALAHPAMRAMYPTPREHERETLVANQLALSVEQVKNESREEHAKLLAGQAEMARDIAVMKTWMKARGMVVRFPPPVVSMGTR